MSSAVTNEFSHRKRKCDFAVRYGTYQITEPTAGKGPNNPVSPLPHQNAQSNTAVTEEQKSTVLQWPSQGPDSPLRICGTI